MFNSIIPDHTEPAKTAPEKTEGGGTRSNTIPIDSPSTWHFSWKTVVSIVSATILVVGLYQTIKYDGRATRGLVEDQIAQQKERDRENRDRINQLAADLGRANDGITSIRAYNALAEVRIKALEDGQKDLGTRLDVNDMKDQLIREKVIKIEYKVENNPRLKFDD